MGEGFGDRSGCAVQQICDQTVIAAVFEPHTAVGIGELPVLYADVRHGRTRTDLTMYPAKDLGRRLEEQRARRR